MFFHRASRLFPFNNRVGVGEAGRGGESVRSELFLRENHRLFLMCTNFKQGA